MPLGRDYDDHRKAAVSGALILGLALLPTLAAVWAVPGFVTQDGPAHVYNAHILLESLRLGQDSPFAEVFEATWRPLPNLGGHLALMGMLTVLPPQAADRAMTALSLAGFAMAILWLRWRVSGSLGFGPSALLAALLAINMPWLMGFSNFLIGATLALLTWGLWWNWRDRLGMGQVVTLGGMLVVGYFGHLVSLGLTAVGLVVLAAMAPGPRPDRLRRLSRTLLACAPLVPLALLYKALTAEGGAFEPSWEQSGPFWSPAVWARRLSWVDPIAIGRRDLAPFWPDHDGRWCILLSPSLWLGIGLAALVGGSLRRRSSGDGLLPRDGRRAWAVLACLLLLGAMIGPDGFGDDHGYFLTQRVALIGLACLVPVLPLDPNQRWGRLGTALIGLALALQSAFVWDYAIESDRRAGQILRAAPEVGRGNRIGTLLVDIRGRYRSNPLLHVDCLLGTGAGNIIWSNYETRHYYFPVQIRPEIDAPPSSVFEEIAILDDPDDADERAQSWADVLSDYGQAIDVVVTWGHDPALDAITARWAGQGPSYRSGAVQITRRSASRDDPSTRARSGGHVASWPHEPGQLPRNHSP